MVLLVGCSAPTPATDPEPVCEYPVRVVYLYPADQERFAEYEKAIPRVVDEIRTWYRSKTGLAFKALPLEVVQSKDDYFTMRCGTTEPEREAGQIDPLYMPAWIESVERAVGGWRAQTATLVFAQGGGGMAQANLQGDFAGWCVVGDWVLEPISGKANPKGITAAMCLQKVYVTGGTPVGTVAHELAHAFGVHHPDGYETSKRSLMRAHWDWPDTNFLDHEKLVLKTSPFTATRDWDGGAPHCDYLTNDVAEWGKPLDLIGSGFKEGDEVEFKDLAGLHRVKPTSIAADKIVVTVPKAGPGVVRVIRYTTRSNAVPVNVYERKP